MNNDELQWIREQITALQTRISTLSRNQSSRTKTIGACIDTTSKNDLPATAAKGKLYLVTDETIGTGQGIVVYFDGNNWVSITTGDII